MMCNKRTPRNFLQQNSCI